MEKTEETVRRGTTPSPLEVGTWVTLVTTLGRQRLTELDLLRKAEVLR